MKVCVSTDSEMVCVHFGRSPQFTIAEIRNGKVEKKEVINNPGHATGFLPKFLSEKGVEYIIAGGAGFKAQESFQQYRIKLVLGASGSVEEVLQSFARGNLENEQNKCNPSSGRGFGVKKEDGHEE